MQKLIVLNVVGLSPRHLDRHMPRLKAFAQRGCLRPLTPVFPAVTCSVQSSMLTGLPPHEHGIVGNGWYFRDLAEIWFWRQSNQLVTGEKIWDAAKKLDPAFTCANLFWWYNMAASHDIGVTPRPIYKADGRKLPDCYAQPPSLRDRLTKRLGAFPLFKFWGPATGIESSRWIADSARQVMAEHDPTLTLVYLPHLDYDLQRHGPDENHPAVARSLAEIDEVAGNLIADAQALGRRVVVLSEYGITAVDRPVHLNRRLREAGFLAVREEDGAELLDPIASRAFAVADHQAAHVYVRDASDIGAVRQLLETTPGVDAVWAGGERDGIGLDHERAGELVVMADSRSWFTYYYWRDDRRAPDFARTVDIHRKPGYDPAELFVDPEMSWPKLAVLSRLLRRKLGFRTLMNVIGLNADIVKGSHGRPADDERSGPLFIVDRKDPLPGGPVAAVDVKRRLLDIVFERSGRAGLGSPGVPSLDAEGARQGQAHEYASD